MSRLIQAHASNAVGRFFITWVMGIWFLIILFDPIAGIADLPVTALNLIGLPLKLLPEAVKPLFFNASVLHVFKLLILLSLAGRMLNFCPKTTGIIAAVLLTVHQALVRGFGFINHAELAFLFAVYAIVLTDISRVFIRQEDKAFNFSSVPIVMSLLFMCFSYSFVGVRRIVDGGMAIYLTDSIVYATIRNACQWGNSVTLATLNAVLNQEWLTNMIRFGFPVVSLFETLAPLALISARFRYAFVAVMLPFHILTYLLMGIFFWQNMMLYIFFFDLNHLFKKDAVSR